MKPHCVVVANASHARVFTRESSKAPLVPLESLAHPESRQRAAELGDDRPGREATDSRSGASPYQPRTDPLRKEHRRFAVEIAARLEELLTRGEFALWIFASDPFLGELKRELSANVRERLQAAVPSDYTALDLNALQARLDQQPTA